MSTYAIGDIHGCLQTFNKLLNEIGYDKYNDKLILLGDYIDRGVDSKGVLKRIIELQKDGNVIVLMGNHEYDALLSDTYIEFHDWIDSLPFIYEDDKFIYVHAGLKPSVDLYKQSKYDLLNIRGEFLRNYNKFNKRVVFGHTPVVVPKIMDNGIIPIDTGCVYTQNGKLTAFNVEDEYFVSVDNIDDINHKKEPFKKKLIRNIINNNINKQYFDISVGWWLDNEVMTLYHGTSIDNVDNIISNGLLGTNTHFIHLTFDMNTAYGFSIFKHGYEESLTNFQFNNKNQRCLIELKFNIDDFLYRILDINFSYGTSYSRLSDRKVYDDFIGTDNEYYKYTEFILTESIEKKYITNIIRCNM